MGNSSFCVISNQYSIFKDNFSALPKLTTLSFVLLNTLSKAVILLLLLLLFCSTGVWTQDFAFVKQVSATWATLPILLWLF
jgi:hypothetical protein